MASDLAEANTASVVTALTSSPDSDAVAGGSPNTCLRLFSHITAALVISGALPDEWVKLRNPGFAA